MTMDGSSRLLGHPCRGRRVSSFLVNALFFFGAGGGWGVDVLDTASSEGGTKEN